MIGKGIEGCLGSSGGNCPVCNQAIKVQMLVRNHTIDSVYEFVNNMFVREEQRYAHLYNK